jgi:hypothetical protein
MRGSRRAARAPKVPEGRGWPVEILRIKKRKFLAANVAPIFPPFRRRGQGGLLKSCRLRSGAFSPRMLRQFSPPLEGGARGGAFRRAPSQNRRATENVESPAAKFANIARSAPAQGQGGCTPAGAITKPSRNRKRRIVRRAMRQYSPLFPRPGRGSRRAAQALASWPRAPFRNRARISSPRRDRLMNVIMVFSSRRDQTPRGRVR